MGTCRERSEVYLCDADRVRPFLRWLRVGLQESKTIQYFCNYCLALVNFLKFLSCIDLVSLKILDHHLHSRAIVSESNIRKRSQIQIPRKREVHAKMELYADVRQKASRLYKKVLNK